MENKFFDNTNQLIAYLEANKDGVLFRGQRDALSWKLTPAIFRKGSLERYLIKIEAKAKINDPFCPQILAEWFHSKEVRRIVNLHLKLDYHFNSFPITVKRLLSLCAFLLKYNYFLGLYVEKNPNSHAFDINTLKLTQIIPYSTWGTKDKFISFLEYALPKILTLTALDGRIIQKGNIDNILTGYNQTFPQHYEFPTAALDLTKNYLIAVHFALEEIENNSECFSIYLYKQIDQSDNSPVIIPEMTEQLKTNIRATLQEGTFAFIQEPCTFYMENGRFPSIDDYDKFFINNNLPSFAEITKCNIPYKSEIITSLREILTANKIDKKLLQPDVSRIPEYP